MTSQKWIVELFYQGKLEAVHAFKYEGEAHDYYLNKLSAIRFGLVGWTVSYPRQEGGGK